jgi:hypothetical protein
VLVISGIKNKFGARGSENINKKLYLFDVFCCKLEDQRKVLRKKAPEKIRAAQKLKITKMAIQLSHCKSLPIKD